MSTTVISLEDVSKRFVIRKEKSLKERVVNFGRSNLHKDDFWALRNINVEVKSGTTVGLVGANGSGKSTLLKAIGGIIQPTSGSVRLRGRLAALLELGAGFHPDLTGRENVYLNASILGLSRAQTDRHFDAIVEFSGIERFIDTQVKFYSSGMYVRLAFAVSVHVDPDVLLVDEVLAVGDEPFQRKCMDRIRNFQAEGRTIVLVSHSLDQVAELCDRAVVLENGAVVADGVPRDALRVLRAEFDATRQVDVAQMQESTDERPSAVPKAEITSVTIRNGAGTPVSSIRPGESVLVDVLVRSEQRIEDWILGMGIDTPLGQAVFGTNTRLMGISLPPLDGERTYTFQLPHLQLGEGNYSIHGAMSLADGTEVHRLREAAPLSVEFDGRSVGYVAVETSFMGA